MQMIDVLKRLAELDAANPRVVKEGDKGDMDHDGKKEKDSVEWKQNRDAAIKKAMGKKSVKEDQVEECGIMGGMGMPPSHPPTPASINMTAGSADELGNLLKDIVSLAGMKPSMDEPMGMPDMPDMPPPAEPEMGPPDSAVDTMRATIDKLHPETDDEGSDDMPDGEEGDEEADADDEETDEGVLGTMAGAGLGAALGGPLGAAAGGVAGDKIGDWMSDKKEESADGPYDNSPDQANNPPSSKHDAMINKGKHNQDPAGHPGVGDRMDGDKPKAFPTFEAQLMWEYKQFVKE